MELPLPYDWFFLAIRLLFVALIYLFLWQVVRVVWRDMQATAEREAPRRRSSRAKLTVVDAAESDLDVGTVFNVGNRSRIGRHPSCDIAIDEPFLSAYHAEIAQKQGNWYLSDLESTNGTFLNGRQVHGSARVSPSDIVQLGRIKLEFAS